MKNVLIVDDEPQRKVGDVLELLQEKEVKFRYTLKTCILSAIEYIDRSDREKIDLAIVDMGLPYRDNAMIATPFCGLEVVEELLLEEPEAKIIINSPTNIDLELKKIRIKKPENLFQVKSLWQAESWLIKFLTEEHS